MAQNIEPAGGGDGRRERARVVGIDDAECRLQVAMRDAGFRPFFEIVENGDAGRFAPCSGRGRNGHERFDRTRDRQPLADWRVDEIEEIGVVCRVEVGGFGRVDRAAASHGDKRIELAAAGEAGCFAKAGIGRLDDDAVVNIEIDTGRPQRRRGRSLPFRLRRAGSKKTSVRRAPRSTRSCPTSRVIPVPNRRFEAAN